MFSESANLKLPREKEERKEKRGGWVFFDQRKAVQANGKRRNCKLAGTCKNKSGAMGAYVPGVRLAKVIEQGPYSEGA